MNKYEVHEEKENEGMFRISVHEKVLALFFDHLVMIRFVGNRLPPCVITHLQSWYMYMLCGPIFTCVHACSAVKLCLILCHPMNRSPLSSSVHGIFQARILEWVATSSSRGSSWPRDRTRVSCISCTGRWVLYHWATWEAPYPYLHMFKAEQFFNSF